MPFFRGGRPTNGQTPPRGPNGPTIPRAATPNVGKRVIPRVQGRAVAMPTLHRKPASAPATAPRKLPVIHKAPVGPPRAASGGPVAPHTAGIRHNQVKPQRGRGRTNIDGKRVFGRTARHILRDRLRAANNQLPPPPASYSPKATYRVSMSEPYTLSGNHVLRPGDVVIITGALAAQIADIIVGAQQVA